MRNLYRRSGLLGAIVLAVAVLAGSASGGTAQTSAATHRLNVGVAEWAVIPSDGIVSAGALRLTVENFGRIRHEIVIFPTERWGQKLPIRNGQAVGEPAAHPIVVAPGERGTAWVNLAPGPYVLLDNLRGHYNAGASVSIIVVA